MYIISIYVKNTETGNEDFSLIGRDFLPTGTKTILQEFLKQKKKRLIT
ncbi:TPA: hypothetical protein ACL2SA_001678 [Streptococcus pneumoniae]